MTHSCSRSKDGGKCGGPSKDKADRALFIVADGRSCFQHMTREERSFRENCTHSLAPTGTCAYCGQTNVLIRSVTQSPL